MSKIFTELDSIDFLTGELVRIQHLRKTFLQAGADVDRTNSCFADIQKLIISQLAKAAGIAIGVV